jgi:WD40 repeat protein
MDMTIKLWNKKTGELVRTLSDHSSTVSSVAFDNVDILASGSYDGTIKVWSKDS